MNDRAHWLSLFSAAMLLAIASAGPLGIGPPFLPPSWALIYALVPGGWWLYPSAFALTGGVALSGIWNATALRVSCWMSAALFAMWGLAGLYLTAVGAPGGNIQGSAANLFTAGQALVMAYYVSLGVRGDRINEKVVQLAEKVHEVAVETNGSPGPLA